MVRLTSLADVEQLQKKLAGKDVQIRELNDRSFNSYAKLENERTIARRDVENTRKYAIIPFTKSNLSVSDNLGLFSKLHVKIMNL